MVVKTDADCGPRFLSTNSLCSEWQKMMVSEIQVILPKKQSMEKPTSHRATEEDATVCPEHRQAGASSETWWSWGDGKWASACHPYLHPPHIQIGGCR